MITVHQIQQSPETVAILQGVLAAAPAYSKFTSGVVPCEGSAASIFNALPPGKAREDKFVLGVYSGETCVGVIDLIRGYPDPETAMLGLLLIAESHHGLGIGRSAYAQAEAVVRTWSKVRRVRIGVVESNAHVLPFWLRLGFQLTGEIKPYQNGSVVSKVEILVRELESGRWCRLRRINED